MLVAKRSKKKIVQKKKEVSG